MYIIANKIVFSLVMALMLLGLGMATAAENASDDNDAPTYRQIDGMVVSIDAITGDQMIIGDTVYSRTSETQYYDLKGIHTGSSKFKVGTWVKVVADEEFKLSALYLAAPEEEVVKTPTVSGEGSQSSGSGSGDSGNGELRLENGVWVN